MRKCSECKARDVDGSGPRCEYCTERFVRVCDCYVQRLDEETRFSLHLGAHSLKCPVYVKSLDPVDFANDEDMRHIIGEED